LIQRPAGLFSDDEWTFVLTVRADPLDRGHWLVYSDWLTDQDDIRGDYLRMRVPLFGLSDAEIQAHPSVRRITEMEREHLQGSTWWLRVVELIPIGDDLLSGPANVFHEWMEARFRRRIRPET
jgi:uncharacterized protein (TIGR02996 family)